MGNYKIIFITNDDLNPGSNRLKMRDTIFAKLLSKITKKFLAVISHLHKNYGAELTKRETWSFSS